MNQLDNIKALLFVLDPADRVVALSPALLKLLESPASAFVGKSADDLFEGSSGWLSGIVRATVRFRCKGVQYSAIINISPVPVSKERVFRVCLLSRVGTDASVDRSASASNSGASVPVPAALPVVAKNAESAAFDADVRSLLKSVGGSSRLTAGRIELIGMEEVKAALGERWPTSAARAKSIARSVLEKRLANEDVFTESSNDTFIICFSSLGVDEASLKAHLIAREIRERLLGESNTPFVVNSEVETLELSNGQVDQQADLVPALIAKMDEARAKRRKTSKVHAGELLRKATLRLQAVQTKSRMQTGLMIARIDGDHAPELAGIGTDSDNARMIFELDALLLGMVSEHIYAAFSGGGVPPIVVPVSFITLRERRYARDYIDLCHTIDECARGRIVFEVYNVPPDVPDSRLQDLLACLAPFSAHRLLRAPSLEKRFVDLNRFRLSMMSLRASRAHIDDPRKQRAFRGFASMVHNSGTFVGMMNNCGCRLLVRDVGDESQACWYVANGADFVSLT